MVGLISDPIADLIADLISGLMAAHSGTLLAERTEEGCNEG